MLCLHLQIFSCVFSVGERNDRILNRIVSRTFCHAHRNLDTYECIHPSTDALQALSTASRRVVPVR